MVYVLRMRASVHGRSRVALSAKGHGGVRKGEGGGVKGRRVGAGSRQQSVSGR